MFPNTNSLSNSPHSDSFHRNSTSKRWEETIAWVTHGKRLSRPIRNPPKDFSDGALVAEIIAQHLPRYVLSLNSFPQVHSLALKKYNWETLERTVLRHLGIHISTEHIESLANAEEGTIQNFLPILRSQIDDAISKRHFRPSSTSSRGPSRCCSRGGSQLHLDQIGTSERQREQTNGTDKTEGNGEGNGRPKVLDELDKDQLVERLYAKVREQEAQLRKKDEQIEALSRKVEKLVELVCEEMEADKRMNKPNDDGKAKQKEPAEVENDQKGAPRGLEKDGQTDEGQREQKQGESAEERQAEERRRGRHELGGKDEKRQNA
ncbi:hypothetical protein niasHS_007518 [Heterodera schachtii]|uniref:CH-like domain-containing protein n=1 Tax=Heterodera schachtii TaxID=97005 RepID=A0ABD2JXV7_HETSC